MFDFVINIWFGEGGKEEYNIFENIKINMKCQKKPLQESKLINF